MTNNVKELGEKIVKAYYETVAPLEAELNRALWEFHKTVQEFYRNNDLYWDEGTYGWANRGGWSRTSAPYISGEGVELTYDDDYYDGKFLSFEEMENISELLEADLKAVVAARNGEEAARKAARRAELEAELAALDAE